MRTARFVLLVIVAISLVAPVVLAGEGSVERGKKYFEDPTFAGGKKSCNNRRCHRDGRGIEDADEKTNFTIFGRKADSLEEAVNICIVNANKGKAIPEDSQEMKDIVAFIKSLGEEETPGYDSPGYGAPGYGAPGY
jgi:cytochrome c